MKCDKKDLLLYAVTDRSWLNGETLYSQVEKALEGGATFVQLREKHLDHDAFLQEAKEIKELLQNKEELEKLISYKRQEESIRKGGIDADIKIKDFTYLKQDFNEDLLKEFENMQNKYVLNDKYKIEISEVKNTLNEIINNENII